MWFLRFIDPWAGVQSLPPTRRKDVSPPFLFSDFNFIFSPLANLQPQSLGIFRTGYQFPVFVMWNQIHTIWSRCCLGKMAGSKACRKTEPGGDPRGHHLLTSGSGLSAHLTGEDFCNSFQSVPVTSSNGEPWRPAEEQRKLTSARSEGPCQEEALIIPIVTREFLVNYPFRVLFWFPPPNLIFKWPLRNKIIIFSNNSINNINY